MRPPTSPSGHGPALLPVPPRVPFGDAGYWGSGSHISSKQNKQRYAPSKQKEQEFDGSYAAFAGCTAKLRIPIRMARAMRAMVFI